LGVIKNESFGNLLEQEVSLISGLPFHAIKILILNHIVIDFTDFVYQILNLRMLDNFLQIIL